MKNTISISRKWISVPVKDTECYLVIKKKTKELMLSNSTREHAGVEVGALLWSHVKRVSYVMDRSKTTQELNLCPEVGVFPQLLHFSLKASKEWKGRKNSQEKFTLQGNGAGSLRSFLGRTEATQIMIHWVLIVYLLQRLCPHFLVTLLGSACY